MRRNQVKGFEEKLNINIFPGFGTGRITYRNSEEIRNKPITRIAKI